MYLFIDGYAFSQEDHGITRKVRVSYRVTLLSFVSFYRAPDYREET